jgi:urea transport system ATP-binding protein
MVPKVNEGLDLSHGTVLYMEDVSVSFDGFKAINELNFYVNAGELRCVIGPNGAGKTTMMDIVTGKTRPDTGTCWFGATHEPAADGRTRDRAGRHRAQVPETHGVRAFHTVFENLELSMAGSKRVLAHPAGEDSARLSVSASKKC